MPNANNETLLTIFVALTGVAVLFQAVILLAIFLALRKSVKSVHEKVDDLRATVLPVINDTREFMGRVGPKIDSVATDMAELVHGLRAQGAELQSSATEIVERVRRQTSRMDAMLTGVLNAVDRAGGLVTEAVSAPLRQMSALAAAAKAVFGTLRNGAPTAAQTHSAADKDMFV
ncbi:MAG: hypothetical protein WAM85_06225 [Terracidiphilus sp.]